MALQTQSPWRVFRAFLLVVFVAAAGLPVVLGGSESAPEISDPAGDTSPASFALQEKNPGLYQNASAYDIVKVWIDLESRDDFWIFIKVRDLPDGWGVAPPPSQFPFGYNITFAGTSLIANFSVLGATYQAVAKLAMPEAGSVIDNYTLWRGGMYLPIKGSYDTLKDQVAMKIPKDEAVLGAPEFGDRLTKFWALGRYGNHSMDFAPNGKEIELSPNDPTVLLETLSGAKLVSPRFGSDYAFGEYPGSVSADLRLTVLGNAQARIQPGGSASHSFELENAAPKADTVYLAVSSPDNGWSHQLSESQFDLAPGAKKTVFLNVAASSSAAQSLRSTVDIASELGADRSASFLTILEGAPSAPSASSGGGWTQPATPTPGSSEPAAWTPAPLDGGEPLDEASGDEGGKESPGFELLLVLLALGLSLFRRKR